MTSKAFELAQLGDVVAVDGSGNVGIGTSSPQDALHIAKASAVLRLEDTDTSHISTIQSGGSGLIISADAANTVASSYTGFSVDGSERMRIDSSGNLLVGKTSSSLSTAGAELRSGGAITGTVSGGVAAALNRLTNDGNILTFNKDGTTVGSIGNAGINSYFSTGDTGLLFAANVDAIIPTNQGSTRDNVIDLGNSGNRFDDIYATNGTIQTSDRNEKQQIAPLTSAEITAAKAISQLFKTYKWNSSVESKGDNARTHTGVVAQEVEQAMTDAGLTASNYAFWCSETWWETSTEVAAVEADEENGIEAQEAYTRIDTFATADEAPEGATERNRKGIRYPELLSFIGAATEQRLTNIETRLDALEAN